MTPVPPGRAFLRGMLYGVPIVVLVIVLPQPWSTVVLLAYVLGAFVWCAFALRDLKKINTEIEQAIVDHEKIHGRSER